MDFVGWFVVGMAIATTLWVIVFVGNVLPAQLDERFRDSLRAFATAVELRFPGHSGVTKRTLELCKLTGYRMGLNRQQLRNLATAALIKDVGLCAIPHRLLNEGSPNDWTPAERNLYETYPEVTLSMIGDNSSLRPLIPLLKQAVTKYVDLPEEKRYTEARILKVVGDYAWLEKQHGQILARDAILHGINDSYDPAVVKEFLPVLTSARDV